MKKSEIEKVMTAILVAAEKQATNPQADELFNNHPSDLRILAEVLVLLDSNSLLEDNDSAMMEDRHE